MFQAQLKGWNEQVDLQNLDSTVTAIGTDLVQSLSEGLDSGFYQTGLPDILDADADGQITWTEWIVGHTDATEIYESYVEQLGGDFAVPTWSFMGSY